MKRIEIAFSLILILLSMGSSAQQLAKGYVFEDTNLNRSRERSEKGIAGVAVTNGVDVVLTDKNGQYTIGVGNDDIISVIKPSRYNVTVDENQLPQFFYIHKPGGSPKLEFEGVKPTGALPRQINFPLVKSDSGEDFEMILFGDPQVKSTESVHYYRKAIVGELQGVKGAAFGLSLGDAVANNPTLFKPYINATKDIGIPWYNVLGNHDLNFDVDVDSLSTESFQAHFGPVNYAFNHGKVHFIVLDNVVYPDSKGSKGYARGLNRKQLTFVENDLKHVPKDYLIVVATHIPLTTGSSFRQQDRDRLFELLKDYPHTLSLSAHTHRQQQIFFTKADGWLQDKPHHHFNSGTTSGSWYSGIFNKDGVPEAMMNDGTPKGYSFIRFTGNQYVIDYKVAGEPKEHQIRIYTPKVVAHAALFPSNIYANFYMGKKGDEVMIKIGAGKWQKMQWVDEVDPTHRAEIVYWDTADTLPAGLRPREGGPSTHLWRIPVPKSLKEGTHEIVVKATDMFGRTFEEKSSIRVETKPQINTVKTQQHTGRKPNIVVIYLDDLGYGDVGAYGATALKTPNMDRLAHGGVRFSNGYATSSTCTPSRFGLLTGVYPWRNESAKILPGDAPLLIDTGTLTLPKVLKQAGYQTGIVGKWHLGLGNGEVDWNQRISPGPNAVGFDYSYIMAATQDRVPTVYIENDKVVNLDPNDPIQVDYNKNFDGEPTGLDNPELISLKWHHGHNNSIVNGIPRIGFMKGGEKARWKDEEMADVFLTKAKSFVKQHKDKPFFLYYAMQQPHVPRTPHPRFVGATDMGPRGDVIAEADWCVGEFLKTLEEEGILENTLIVFSSDNGPVLNDGYYDQAVEKVGNHKPAGPLRGGKYSLFEAGTRVPFVTYWPGVIKPLVSDALVSQVDLLSSMAKLVGVEVPSTDSQDQLNVLMGKSLNGRKDLILEAGSRTALRKGDWVVIPPYNGPAVKETVNIEMGNSSGYQLYNLKNDIGQRENVASKYPEKLKEMIKTFEDIKKSAAN